MHAVMGILKAHAIKLPHLLSCKPWQTPMSGLPLYSNKVGSKQRTVAEQRREHNNGGAEKKSRGTNTRGIKKAMLEELDRHQCFESTYLPWVRASHSLPVDHRNPLPPAGNIQAREFRQG